MTAKQKKALAHAAKILRHTNHQLVDAFAAFLAASTDEERERTFRRCVVLHQDVDLTLRKAS